MAQVDVIMRCTTGSLPLMVRTGPSTAYPIVGSIAVGESGLHATEEQNGWYYIPAKGGWSSGYWLEITQNNATNVQQSQSQAQTAAQAVSQEQQQIETYIGLEDEGMSALDTDVSNLMTTTLQGIYGIPYQFMESVDMKLDGTQFGAIYADRIIARLPLLLITPGRVDFMRDYKSTDSAAQAIQKVIDPNAPTDFSSLLDNHGRYYTLEFDYVDYYKRVDAMCTSGAYFLGLQNTEIKVGKKWTKLKDVQWINNGQNCFKSILSNREYIAFYVDSASSVSESFSNSTTESQLANKINSFSDTGRELNFLLGVTTGNELTQFLTDSGYGDEATIESAMQSVSDIANKYLNGSKLFEDIAQNFATVAVGGKLIFPEIWADSDYSKSYDINIKLRTPNGDKLSWFLNIYVPLAHLICLTAPKEASESGPEAYSTPFLVKAFYKGLFNCDMGIVTSLQLSKGKERAWTLDGLPTEVDVTMEIKDLYSMFVTTSIDNPGAFVNNISLVSYIANSCGININETDFVMMLDVYCMLQGHRLKHVVSNAWYLLQQDVASRIVATNEKLVGYLGNLDRLPFL